jgi:hypothetical protein
MREVEDRNEQRITVEKAKNREEPSIAVKDRGAQ